MRDWTVTQTVSVAELAMGEYRDGALGARVPVDGTRSRERACSTAPILTARPAGHYRRCGQHLQAGRDQPCPARSRCAPHCVGADTSLRRMAANGRNRPRTRVISYTALCRRVPPPSTRLLVHLAGRWRRFLVLASPSRWLCAYQHQYLRIAKC